MCESERERERVLRELVLLTVSREAREDFEHIFACGGLVPFAAPSCYTLVTAIAWLTPLQSLCWQMREIH